ncbi:nitrogen fixation protein FixH [Rhodobacterales bacterium HKCCE3408]|nr:nitrogen fixation protein FixH [Rhodobacterales bacterium HKCCE3408]
MTEKPLTGRHVLALFVLGFGIIIAVNVALAVNAVRTFPGLEVANSYVASQEFDTRRAAQDALGWRADVSYAEAALRLHVTGPAGLDVDPTRFTAVIGRTTTSVQDHVVTFEASGEAGLELAPGRWRVDLSAETDTGPYQRTLFIEVPR